MTGFGKGEGITGDWKVVAYLRSVNGKGLDITVKAPSYILPADQKIKELIKKRIRRGTVHVSLDIQPLGASIPIDVERLKSNIELLKAIAGKEAGLSVEDDTLFQLAWKYSEKTTIELDPDLESAILSAVETAVDDLVKSREREGRVLKDDLVARAKKIQELSKRIVERKDEIIERTKAKVLERAKSLSLPQDHPTVMNEIVFILERMDVEEEVTRLKSHLERFLSAIEAEGEVGKKLEFIAQEMHREITTLGNKIPDLSEFVVEIKTEIDRIKQQCANVE